MARGELGKPRSSVSVILLSIVTIGIYGIYWQYRTFKEMKRYSGEGIGGALALVFTLTFILYLVNIFKMPAEVGDLYAREGQPKPVSGATGFWVFLPFVGGIIWLVKTQGNLSKFWEAHGAH